MQQSGNLGKLVGKYWLELTIGAVAIVTLLVGIIISRSGGGGGAASAPAPAAPGVAVVEGQSASAVLKGPTGFSLDSLAYGKTDRVIVAEKQHVVSMRKGESLTIRGWAFDGPNEAAASSVVAQVDNVARATQTGLTERPDVAKVYNNPKYDHSGYAIVIPAELLPVGTHDITMLVGDSEMTGFYVEKDHLKVIVSDAGSHAK